MMPITYDLRDFTEEQRTFFKRAEAEGLDVSYIYDPAFSTDQMIEICEGLQADIDVEPFAKPEYSWDQMQELCEGIKAELDISIFSNPSFPASQMRKIRECLLAKEPYEEYLDSSKFPVINSAQAYIQYLKERYPAGTRVGILFQQGDFTPEKGTTGVVNSVDNEGNIHIIWDNGDERQIVQDTKILEVISDE